MISLKQILSEQGLIRPSAPTLGNTSSQKPSFAKKPSIKSKTNLDKFNDTLKQPAEFNYELHSPPDVDIRMSDKNTFSIRTRLGIKSNEYKLSLSGLGANAIKLKSIQLEYSDTPEERKSDDYIWPGLLYPKTKLVARFHVPLIGKIKTDNVSNIIKISGDIVTVTIKNDFDLYTLFAKLLRGESSININKMLEPIIGIAANNQKIKGVLRKIS